MIRYKGLRLLSSILFTAIFACVMILSGCSAVPIKQSFPTAPESLLQPPLEMSPANESTKLSDFLLTVTDNYSICDSNANRLQSWIDWYTEQKRIFEE